MYVDAEAQTIVCKIVYYGPGLAGKSTNFQYLKEHADIQSGQLISTDVDAERILHFQFVRNNLPQFKNYRLIFDFHTIPGQSYYINSRLKLLEGADGIVFIVDSRREAMDENIDSMNDLYGNLRKQAIANDIPLVVQFNKQDLPSALPVPQLDPLLNSTMKQSFASSAHTGQGIIETMEHITNEVISYIEYQGFESSGSYPALNTPNSPLASEDSLTPVKQNTLNHSPVTASITNNQYLLLTCYSCESLLEVATAAAGDMFACGTCQQTLQVIDPDRGITGPPQAVPPPVAATPSAAPTPVHEDSSYGMATLPTPQTGQKQREPSEYGMASLAAEDSAGALSTDASASDSGPIPPELPTILDQYITLSELDHSLIGQRYMLQDKNTGIRVRALVISQEMHRQPAFQTILENHVRQASQVKHQNICGFLGMQYYGQLPVLLSQASEDCESLAAIIERRNKFSPPQAIEIAHKIALGLEAASRANVHHGWVRPECILIGSNGTVIIDDLAVPKQHNYLVRESRGRTAASEYYLAPEHASSEIQSDERSDVFLLGLLLFKMLTGQGILMGFNAHEAMHKIKGTGCRSLRSVETDLSRELDSLCSQMTAIERKDRIQSMSELADLLAQFGGGAKRHTLRATRSHTGQHSRAKENGARHTGTHNRSQTGNSRTTHGATRSISAHGGRTAHGPNTYNEMPARRSKKKSNSSFMLIVFLLILGTAAAYIWKTVQDQERAREYQLNVDQEAAQRKKLRENPNGAQTDNNAPQTKIRNSPATRIAALLDDYELTADEATLNEITIAIRALKKRSKNNKVAIRLQGRLNDIRVAHSNTEITTPTNTQDDGAHVTAISSAITTEKFALAQKEALEIDDKKIKTQQDKKISAALQELKMSVQLTVNSSFDINEINTLLDKPLHTWGLEAEKEWALNLKKSSIQRIAAREQQKKEDDAKIAQAQKSQKVRTPDPVANEITVPNTIHGIDFQSLLIGSEILELLKERKFNDANSSCDLLPASYIEHRALSLMIQLHQHSFPTMSTAFAERGVKFRITGPFNDKQKWSLISFNKNSLQIRSPEGSQAAAKWDKLDAGDAGQLYSIIASHADGTAKEFAMSAIAYLLDNEIGRAKIAASQARKKKYPQMKELDLLINISKHSASAFICDSLVEAIKAHDKKSIRRELAAIKASNAASDEEVMKIIAVVDTQTQRSPTDGPKNTHASALKNTLDFSDADDLLAFTMRIGSWTIADGQLRCLADGSQLERDDAQRVQSISFDLTLTDTKGTITILFRGVELRIKLNDQGFQLAHGEHITELKGFPFLAQLPYTITMKLEVDNTMRVSINQTAEQTIRVSADMDNGKIGFDVQGNQNLSFDNLILERDLSTLLPDVDMEKQTLLKTALGWDPVGGAELHAPHIILPPWPGARSAIVRSLSVRNTSVSFEAKGSGDLFIMLGDHDTGDQDGLKVPMPLDGDAILFITISWTNTSMRIESREGENGDIQINTINDLKVPLKHLSIESSRNIIILKPPQLK